MRSLILKDKKRRFVFLRKEFQYKRFSFYKHAFCISRLHSNIPTLKEFFFNYIFVQRKIKNISPVRIRNRCNVSGRGRGILRFFKVSRILVRSYAAAGLLSGVKKSSL
jgi:ribosomal protein S14